MTVFLLRKKVFLSFLLKEALPSADFPCQWTEIKQTEQTSSETGQAWPRLIFVNMSHHSWISESLLQLPSLHVLQMMQIRNE